MDYVLDGGISGLLALSADGRIDQLGLAAQKKT